MKRFIIRTLEAISYLALVAFIFAGAGGGFHRAAMAEHFGVGRIEPLVAAAIGGIVGFLAFCVVFGVVFALIEIADNTRRTRELIEAQVRRAP